MPNQSLKDRLNAAVKDALRGGQKERLGTLRMIMAEIKQREVDERITLDDDQVLAVFDKMMKARKEASEQYRAANRHDIADKEEREIAVIKEFLPRQFSETELDGMIAEAISATNAASMKDMAGVMTHLRPLLQGRADLGAVGAKVKARLSR
ncbi:MAG: GatB/YqeY domain-containing protein [Planctomycetes bacterium]|nr:GatB/YqeY domain-containing protein [Planctomycetota bacterium]